MTIVIADNSPRKTYTATANQTDFPTEFAFFAKADVNVYVNGTLKTLDSDFSIPTTGPNAWTSGNDGTIVFTTGLSAGDSVVLTRDVELERTTDFPSSGPFQVATLNTELDRIVAMIADLEDLASRGITLADSDTGDTASLPDVTARKGRVLAFENDSTAAPKAGPLITDVQSVADVSADIANLADIEDGTVATDAISNLAAVRSDVTTAASNITAIQNASANATTATTKATEAAASATAAAASATAAAASETAAETAETNAETAETNAATSATNAATSATSAASSATTATTKASEASTSATNAATSATSASTAQTAAETAQTAAETAKTAAETAKTGAETAQTAAETAQTAAETAETNAATSETNAATSATTATTKASEAATSATNAAASATSAASAQSAAESARDSALASFDSFDDRYLGTKTSDPTVDNDGDALVAGALYFNSTDGEMKVYNGTSWVDAYADGASLVSKSGDTMTGALVINADLTVDTNTLHVDSTNNVVGVGTTSASSYLAEGNNLVIADSGHSGITLASGTSSEGGIFFADGTSGTDRYRGMIRYNHSSNYMEFRTDAGERMRIDSSGNLLVGQSSADNTATGVSARSDGRLFATRDSDQPAYFNRLTNDGTLIEMAKDSSLVGSLFTYNGFLGIGSTSGNDAYLLMGSDFVGPSTATGTSRDNAIDLGSDGRRFKNFYVGGNIYLGGTGSANALDDYEEGSWTPTVDNGTISHSGAKYTKVGRMVNVSAYIYNFSNRTNTGAIVIRGLPFTAASNQYAVDATMHRYINGGGDSVVTYITGNNAYAHVYANRNNTQWVLINHNDLSSSNSLFFVNMKYHTT